MNEKVLSGVIGELRQVLSDWKKTPSYRKVVGYQEGVLARFGPVFSREHVGHITEQELQPFLLDKNNRHWNGLHRQGGKMCANMRDLRESLSLLIDQSQPLAGRLDKATGMISGMGKNIASAILLVAFPKDYGVWNNRSEANMKRLGIWPELGRGESFGARYAKVNQVLLKLRDELDIDLWTLDYLWWHLDERSLGHPDHLVTDDVIEAVVSPRDPDATQAFGLERHLHEFLLENWDSTELGKEWALYQEPGDEEAGYEYPCDVGRIDLLAKHRKKPRWLVVELKRNQTSDQTVGQLLRYMGWVREHLAGTGEDVYGMIICHETDDALHYAISNVSNVDVRLYEVEFRLKPSAKRTTTTTKCTPLT